VIFYCVLGQGDTGVRAFGGSNICFLKKNVVAVLMASYEKELNLFFDVCLGYLDGDDL